MAFVVNRQKAAELFTPIQKKFNETVMQVAIENGYGCVLDLCDDWELPFPPGRDITGLVIAKLGLYCYLTMITYF